MLLDSCFLIDLMNSDKGAVAKLEELVERAEPLTVSALSVTEVGYGLRSEQEQADFDDILSRTDVVSFDSDDARRASRILRRTEKEGERVGKIDAMVGAIAVGRDEAVVTRNVSEFRRVDGVRVSPY